MPQPDPATLRADLAGFLSEALGADPERTDLAGIEHHFLPVIEAIWQIECRFGVSVPFNDNLPAAGIHNGQDLLCFLADALGADALGADALGAAALGADALGADALGAAALGADALGAAALGAAALGAAA